MSKPLRYILQQSNNIVTPTVSYVQLVVVCAADRTENLKLMANMGLPLGLPKPGRAFVDC